MPRWLLDGVSAASQARGLRPIEGVELLLSASLRLLVGRVLVRIGPVELHLLGGPCGFMLRLHKIEGDNILRGCFKRAPNYVHQSRNHRIT